MNSIPPLDLTQQYQRIGDEVSAAVLDILASGQYINGPVVADFEQRFAEYIGTAECVACNSGTDALLLAMRAYNVGAGDEVITTPFTFFATAEMMTVVGATPVFVDIDPDTFNLDLDQVEAAITPRTKAIAPVHLFGQAVDMTRLMAIAQAHELLVIEDAAQAVGSQWRGQRVGSFGQAGCFSFFPTKNLGACGDGGAVTTNDPAIAARMRMLREHGSKTRYYHEDIGMTSRLDAVQAAILRIKLRYLEEWNEGRRAIAQRYHDLLRPIPGIIPPSVSPDGLPVWHQYTLRLTQASQPGAPPDFRNQVRAQMIQQGVTPMIYYPVPLHQQVVYQSLGYQPGQLPVVERLCGQVLSLPMFPELTPEQQEQVVYTLKDALEKVGSP